MLTTRLTKCPVAFLGVAGALVVIVSAVHVFMVPILPSSLNYFSARGSVSPPRNVLPGVGVVNSRLRGQFPSDSHGAVVFRGAPWKAEIGRWLAGCHANSSSVNATEVCAYLCHCPLCFVLAGFVLISFALLLDRL
jgi:putative beta-1,4-xylosyltransferase IRX10